MNLEITTNTKLVFEFPLVLADYEGKPYDKTYKIFQYLEQFTNIERVSIVCNQGGAAWYLYALAQGNEKMIEKFKSPERVLRLMESFDSLISNIIKIDWFVALHPGDYLIGKTDEAYCNELSYKVDNIWKFDLAHRIKSLTTFTGYLDRLPNTKMIERAISDSFEYFVISNDDISSICRQKNFNFVHINSLF